MNFAESEVVLKVGDSTEMTAFVARPTGPGPFPGLVLFQEAFGVNHHIRSVAGRFAAEGYLVIAPELFHRTAPVGFTCAYTDFPTARQHFEVITEADLERDVSAAWDWLQAQPLLRPGVVACIGYCLGGRAAFLANSIKPFRAAVSYYGGGIAPGLLNRAATQHAPILLCWGGLDQRITPDKVAQVTAALRAANKPHVNVEFSHADHGFFCDERAAYQPQAAREAWALTLAFLRENLASSG